MRPLGRCASAEERSSGSAATRVMSGSATPTLGCDQRLETCASSVHGRRDQGSRPPPPVLDVQYRPHGPRLPAARVLLTTANQLADITVLSRKITAPVSTCVSGLIQV